MIHVVAVIGKSNNVNGTMAPQVIILMGHLFIHLGHVKKKKEIEIITDQLRANF